MKAVSPATRILLGVLPLLWATPLLAQEGELGPSWPREPEPSPPVEPWHEALRLRAFADAYGSINYNFPKPQRNANRFRAFDQHAGFALGWVGADVSYDPEPVGGLVQLRWGPTARRHGGPDADHGLEFIKQAFASFRPGGGRFTFDFGKFDTIYGTEVAESQDNPTYSRGLLFWLAQPRFHTGLRATWEVSDAVALRVLAVNGWNNSVDNNVGKSFGAQIGYTPTRRFALRLGWFGGPEQDDTLTITCPAGQAYSPDAQGCAESADPEASVPAEYTVDRGGANELSAFRHLIDLVVTFAPVENLALSLNADYGTEKRRDPFTTGTERLEWYGAALTARWALTATWALAGRGEYLHNPDIAAAERDELGLVSGTLTLEAKPSDSLIIRLEQRGDLATGGDSRSERQLFARRVRDETSQQLTTTLGVVVTTP